MFMKNISKFTIALLISLWIPTVCFSQDTYPKTVNDTLILLTSKQLKHTNLIFAEHNMLLKKVDLLESQTRQYKKLIRNYEQNDSLHSELLESNKIYYLNKLNALDKELKRETRKKKAYKIGMVGSIVAAVFAIIYLK